MPMTNDQAIEQAEDDDAPLVAPGKSRAEAVKRLQIGLTGLFAMLLLVSLADIIRDRAAESEKGNVADVTASVQAGASEAPSNKDPLADAGLVPELPAEPSASPAAGGQAGNVSPQP